MESMVVRGRILARPLRHVQDDRGLLFNLRNMVALFLTDELVGVPVRHGVIETESDEEGYFQLEVPRTGGTGWRDVVVEVSGADTPVPCPVLLPRPDARVMVISDIDDTVLQTGAYSLLRNLWTTFTGSAATRRVFPDAVALMDALSEEDRNPIYYVSSSPWNLHGFLVDVFDGAGLKRGPMFLRDLGLSETKFLTEEHGRHKGESIDLLLAANPDLSAILVGDTGQKDAEIYAEAVRRHPGRIRAVILRTAGPDRIEANRLDELRAIGLPTLVGPDFAVLEPRLRSLLAEDDAFVGRRTSG
jgi:phosphatidate phosphatase APP1